MKSCPKCNFDKIVPNVMVLDRGDGNSEYLLQIAVDETPNALIFKSRQRSNVSAWVCGNCGYLEFYADNPEFFYQAYCRMMSNRKQKEKNL